MPGVDAPSFVLPPIHDNADAWGPSPDALPEQFKDIPYAPFSKSDKIGRIVDWNSDPSSSAVGSNARGNFRNTRNQRENYGAGQAGTFAYYHDEDEASFNLVGGGSTGRKAGAGGGLGGLARGGGARGRGARGSVRGARGAGKFSDRGGGAGRRGGGNWGRGGWRGDWNDRNTRTRESSIVVGPEWHVLEEIEFSRLSKLRLDVDTDEPEDLGDYGFLHEYDRAIDRINGKNPQPLQILDRVRYHPTASEDPILQEYANQNQAQVFTTDSVLSLLMCAPRSVYSWDIVMIRDGNKLWMDKREGGPFDFISVNENAADPPLESEKPDSLNTPAALSLEATFINSNFGLQSVKEDADTLNLSKPNPFYGSDETEPCASAGLRYRKFDLSISEKEHLDLVVRTEVDSVIRAGTTIPNSNNSGERDTFITIRTLNEFEFGAQGSGNQLNWRSKLDSQRGAVVATEMKNNSSKLAKWAIQSILAGAEQMKIGYISRANPRDSSRHVILGQQWFKPKDFASQMNVNLANGWGIVRTVVDIAMKSPPGKYVLLKDPNKPVVRFYRVPDNAFDVIEEEEMEEEVEEEDDFDYGI